MSTKKIDQKKTREGQPQVIKREIKVPTKVRVGENDPLELVPSTSSPLKGCWEVIISDGKTTRRMVFHHPIGVTDLDGEDWVCSDASSIPELLVRTKNPDANRLNEERSHYKMSACAAVGLLKNRNGDFYYPHIEDETRSQIVFLAREAEKRFLAKRATEKKKAPATEWFMFLDQDTRHYEDLIQQYLKSDELKEEVEINKPDTFRTRSGRLNDQDQVRANAEGEVIPPGSAFDAFALMVSRIKILPLFKIERDTEGTEVKALESANPRFQPHPVKGTRVLDEPNFGVESELGGGEQGVKTEAPPLLESGVKPDPSPGEEKFVRQVIPASGGRGKPVVPFPPEDLKSKLKSIETPPTGSVGFPPITKAPDPATETKQVRFTPHILLKGTERWADQEDGDPPDNPNLHEGRTPRAST